MINALIISGGSLQGSAVVKGLRQSCEIRIHLADCYKENINKYECDIFHKVPLLGQEESFIEKLAHIVKKENIDVIIPSTDHELELLTRAKDKIETGGAKIAVSKYELIRILINKQKCYQFLKEHGFPLLESVDLEQKNLKFPIIGKPSYGFGSKGLIILKSKQDLNQLTNNQPVCEYLWLPFLYSYEEFSIDFAISFSGKISPITIRKRIRTAGGFAVISENENNDIIERKTLRLAKILRELGGCGIFNVQVLRYGEGLLHFSDINPRIGTSSVFTLGVGVNLPLYMCLPEQENKSSKRIEHGDFKKKKMIRNLSETWIEIIPKGVIKGIVFDLDDTLIDQKAWIFDKLEIVYEQYTHKLPDKDLFMFAAYQFLEEGKRGTLIDELKHKFQLSENLRIDLIESFRKANPKNIQVYNDVVHNIAKLKQHGYKIGLLTDNPVPSQQQKIKMLEFKSYFDVIILSMEFSREKPDPILFEKMAKKLDENFDQLAMVGDNLCRDCYGAIKAGYGKAFYIERKGTFFNFNYSGFKKMVNEPADKIVRIKSLNELYYAFEED